MTPRTNGSDMLRMAMRCFDAGIAMGVSWLAFLLMPSLAYREGIEYPLLILVGSLLLPAVGELFGLYRPWRGRSLFSMFGVYLLSWLTTIVIVSLFLVMTKSTHTFSRLWMAISAAGVAGAGLVLRGALYHYLRRLRAAGRNLKCVVVIGTPSNVERIQAHLSGMRYIGYRVQRTILVDDPQALPGRIEALVNEATFTRDFHEIWLSLPLSQGETVKCIAEKLIALPVDVRYFPDLTDVRLLNHRMTQVADLFSLDLNYSPLDGASRIVKNIEDRVLGGFLFVGFMPVMLLIALLVACTMGRPVLFKQHRHGLDGKRFRIYKFRTMRAHAAGACLKQAQRNDPRITSLGHFLRRTSLDELPQLYNVLQGRMSLVGPRPHAMDHNVYYKDVIADYMQRHRVKPGMTGWAQVNGLRGETRELRDMEKRVNYDLFYINNWSLGLDLKILAMTFKRGFFNHQP